jgi:hypothetical protein
MLQRDTRVNFRFYLHPTIPASLFCQSRTKWIARRWTLLVYNRLYLIQISFETIRPILTISWIYFVVSLWLLLNSILSKIMSVIWYQLIHFLCNSHLKLYLNRLSFSSWFWIYYICRKMIEVWRRKTRFISRVS